MAKFTILVVDDEIAIRQILSNIITRAGHDVITAEDGYMALSILKEREVDVTFSDVRMPGITGIELIEHARKAGINCQFVIMTAFASVSTAIDAMKAGAYDYMMKPLRHEDVEHRLQLIGNMINLHKENTALRQVAMQVSEQAMSSTADSMKTVERLINKVAATESTVMIGGESGTGKGVTANQIRKLSQRADKPFIPVNCAAIPEQLLESELFGHMKGAFTGANSKKVGLFEAATGGTLFLDEIGELPLSMQAKLLHVLEQKQIRPVGSEKFIPVDVRIIAATNRDLQEMVRNGDFREDLYFRLNIFSINLPPLRERAGDILPLFEFFLNKEARKSGKLNPMRVDSDVEAILQQYSFPGNIRELENIVERAMILADDDVVRVEDLPQQLFQQTQNEADNSNKTLREQLKIIEADIINKAIDSADGDRRLAAKRLGLGLSSLYRKMEEFG